jgi:hypothetical protein
MDFEKKYSDKKVAELYLDSKLFKIEDRAEVKS